MNGIELCLPVKEVFTENSEENNQHFKPLVSIDLGLIDNSLEGRVHVVHGSIDPDHDENEQYMNEFGNTERLVFDCVGGKYRFKGDYRIFSSSEDWKEHLDDNDKTYREFVEKRKTGKKYTQEEMLVAFGNNEYSKYTEMLGANREAADFVYGLGEEVELDEEEIPLNSKGQPMRFICYVNAFEFTEGGETIYLFYDQDDKVAVQVIKFG